MKHSSEKHVTSDLWGWVPFTWWWPYWLFCARMIERCFYLLHLVLSSTKVLRNFSADQLVQNLTKFTITRIVNFIRSTQKENFGSFSSFFRLWCHCFLNTAVDETSNHWNHLIYYKRAKIPLILVSCKWIQWSHILDWIFLRSFIKNVLRC